MGARNKLRAYFLSNLGRVLNSDELRAVSGGIAEWARRVRELRNEEGSIRLTYHVPIPICESIGRRERWQKLI